MGARRRERLHEALGAFDVQLDAAGLERIENAVPPGAAAGTRYAEFLHGRTRQRTLTLVEPAMSSSPPESAHRAESLYGNPVAADRCARR